MQKATSFNDVAIFSFKKIIIEFIFGIRVKMKSFIYVDLILKMGYYKT